MPPVTTSTSERTKPVPVPKALPAAVHYTARTGYKTLQEQMRLQHDGETFRKIVVCTATFLPLMDAPKVFNVQKLIRRTAARHVDLELRYCRQDPQMLKKIMHEVLSTCHLLE